MTTTTPSRLDLFAAAAYAANPRPLHECYAEAVARLAEHEKRTRGAPPGCFWIDRSGPNIDNPLPRTGARRDHNPEWVMKMSKTRDVDAAERLYPPRRLAAAVKEERDQILGTLRLARKTWRRRADAYTCNSAWAEERTYRALTDIVAQIDVAIERIAGRVTAPRGKRG